MSKQAQSADFRSFTYTRPVKTGVSLPATCQTGELFFKTDYPAGSNLLGCTGNVWTLLGGGSAGGANLGSVGEAVFSSTTGSVLEFRRIAGSGRLNVALDGSSTRLNLDVIESGLNLANLGGKLSASQLLSRQGTGSIVPMFGGGTVTPGDCARFDAGGNLVSAGAPCGTGSGGGGSYVAGPGISIDGAVIASQSASVPSYLQMTFGPTWSAVQPGSCQDRTASMPGAAAGDAASVGVPASFPDGMHPAVLVKAAGVVTLRLCNFGSQAVTPSGSFRIWVNKTL